MSFCWKLFLQSACATSLIAQAGCCCCDFSALTNRPGTSTGPTTPVPADPAEAEELATATEYAQKALSAKSYGNLLTAALRKDDLYWYVEGTAQGKEGAGTVNYIVMFSVNHYDNRQTWSVQTVSIDGEVVYP